MSSKQDQEMTYGDTLPPIPVSKVNHALLFGLGYVLFEVSKNKFELRTRKGERVYQDRSVMRVLIHLEKCLPNIDSYLWTLDD